MNLITLATISSFPGGLEGLLFKVAIACVIVWGIWALIKWMGWIIPEPVRIVGICLICIVLIYWLFEIFNAVK
jgi:hypothetical protein